MHNDISMKKLKSLCDSYDKFFGMNKENRFEGECVFMFIINALNIEQNKEKKNKSNMDLKDLW